MFANKNPVGTRCSLGPGELGSCFGKTVWKWVVSPLLVKGVDSCCSDQWPTWFMRVPLSTRSPRVQAGLSRRTGEGVMALPHGCERVERGRPRRKGRAGIQRALRHWGLKAAENADSWPTRLNLWFTGSRFGPWNLLFKRSLGAYEDWMD